MRVIHYESIGWLSSHSVLAVHEGGVLQEPEVIACAVRRLLFHGMYCKRESFSSVQARWWAVARVTIVSSDAVDVWAYDLCSEGPSLFRCVAHGTFYPPTSFFVFRHRRLFVYHIDFSGLVVSGISSAPELGRAEA